MDHWPQLRVCVTQSWTPGFGDPDLVGVVLTLLYLSASAITALAALRLWRLPGAAPGRWFWTLAAAYLILLTVNKQLDIQTFLTQTARCIARAEGWYEDRRALQKELTDAVLIGMALGAVALVLLLRRIPRGNGLMLAGLGLLTGFVALRILSFHHVDGLMRTPLFGLPGYRYLELSALALINIAAVSRAATA